MNEYVSYYLPKSYGYSTPIKKRKPTQAITIIRERLNNFTEYKFSQDINIQFTVPVQDNEIKNYIKKITNDYGRCSIIGQIQTWPDEKVTAEIWEYKDKYSNLDAVLNHLDSHNAFEKAGCNVDINVDFLLKDINGNILKNQGFDKNLLHSSFLISLSKSSVIYPEINFPSNIIMNLKIIMPILKIICHLRLVIDT